MQVDASLGCMLDDADAHALFNSNEISCFSGVVLPVPLKAAMPSSGFE
jgi:hypothetical protein